MKRPPVYQLTGHLNMGSGWILGAAKGSGKRLWVGAAIAFLALIAHGLAHAVACESTKVESVPWQAVAPGVWVWSGDLGDISMENAGHVMPVSVVINGREAAVIDPGPSYKHGERVLRSVECLFGVQVRWVVNTHAHAENVLGNAAFAHLLASASASASTPSFEIVSSSAARLAMGMRCPACLASLKSRIGTEAMSGTAIVLPSRTVEVGDEMPIGKIGLEVVEVLNGHTEGDLVLLQPETGVMWAGGLVYQGRVPELSQGSLDGWLYSLSALEAHAPRHLISAVVSSASLEGEPPPALGATRAYLTALRQGVLQAMDQGRQPQEKNLVPLPQFLHWIGYDTRHQFNVQRAWRELEPVWMDQGQVPFGRGKGQ